MVWKSTNQKKTHITHSVGGCTVIINMYISWLYLKWKNLKHVTVFGRKKSKHTKIKFEYFLTSLLLIPNAKKSKTRDCIWEKKKSKHTKIKSEHFLRRQNATGPTQLHAPFWQDWQCLIVSGQLCVCVCKRTFCWSLDRPLHSCLDKMFKLKPHAGLVMPSAVQI